MIFLILISTFKLGYPAESFFTFRIAGFFTDKEN